MGLYQSVKRVVPNEWKVRVRSLRTLPKDIAVRVWSRFRGGIPLPPKELIYFVTAHRSASTFLRSGHLASKTIRQTLEKHGLEIERLNAVLDFGCGVGRIMRHWNLLQGPVLHGTDYNSRLVEWCQDNLKFAEFQVNTLSHRLRYEPETFDFIYAASVFTHLSEPLQFYWLDELSRVLKPGGHLYFTTHGDYFFPHLRVEEKEKLLNGQLVVRETEQSGSNRCAAFHPATYVRENMTRNFFLVDFIPGSAKRGFLQDIYLFKKPAGASGAIESGHDRADFGHTSTVNPITNYPAG